MHLVYRKTRLGDIGSFADDLVQDTVAIEPTDVSQGRPVPLETGGQTLQSPQSLAVIEEKIDAQLHLCKKGLISKWTGATDVLPACGLLPRDESPACLGLLGVQSQYTDVALCESLLLETVYGALLVPLQASNGGRWSAWCRRWELETSFWVRQAKPVQTGYRSDCDLIRGYLPLE